MGDAPEFAVEVVLRDDSAVVGVEGELDMASVESFEDALTSAAARSHVIVDLRGCTFLDSAGTRAIASAVRDASRVSVVATDAGILRLLEITALDQVVSIHPTLEDAR